MALGRAAFLNSIYMLIGNGGQMIASLGVFLYLARVLSPADFGAMGVAAAIVDLLTVFARFGQVEALLQRGADDQAIRSTAFWGLTAIGLCCLVVIAALAKPLAAFTTTGVVAPVMIVLAAVPLIGNLGQVNEAIMRYEMRYRGIAIRNVVATVGGAGAAAVLATHGFGVYALAAQKLVFTIIYTLTVLIARPWLPSLRYLSSEARRLFSTGLDVTISNTLQMANGRIVDLAIGFFLGVVALGQTRVAWRLYDFSLQLVIAPLSSVSYSLFARVRDKHDEMKRSYLQYVEIITLIAAPIFVGVSLLARDVMVLLAGQKWESSAGVLAVLSLSILASCASLIFSPVMVATGQTRAVRRQAIIQTAANVALTLIAAQISVLAVVIMYLLRMYVFALINVRLMNISLGVTWREFVYRLRPILAGIVGLSAAGLLTRTLLPETHEIIRIFGVAAAGAAGYAFIIFAGDKLRLWPDYVQEFTTAARSILRRKAPVQAEAC